MPPKTPDQSPARPVQYEFIQGLDHKRPPIKLPAPATAADGKPAFETRHFSQLMTLLVHELPLPTLGVRMGGMSKLTDLGTFGYALHSSKNLRELFNTARRYQTLAGYTGLNVHYTPQRLALQFPDQAAIEHRCLIED